MSKVLVSDARLGSAVSIIRSLGRRGLDVVAADSEALSPGFFSRYASERLRYPRPNSAPDAVVEVLLREARARGVDLILPVTDDVIIPLLRARRRFEDVCRLALPENGAWETARDKQATLKLARELKVATPRTALVETAAEARKEAARLGWPVVLKPQASRIYAAAANGRVIEPLHVAYAGGFARLGEQMAQFEGRCPVLVQEYYAGEAHGVELLAWKGRPLAVFQHRRLREVPITGGASSLRESVPLDPALYESATRLLAALEWTGLAMVEFKLGREGPKLMEINGRVWGSLPLAVRSGMDFPALAADLYLKGPPSPGSRPATAYRVGVRSRNLELEIVWIASVLRGERRYPFLNPPRRREALVAAVRLLDSSEGFDILSGEDPRPGLAELVRIAAKIGEKVSHSR